MRRLFQTLLLFGALALTPIAVFSCKNPEVSAYKTIGTQVVSVETAKQAMAEAYVAGQISEADFQRIRTACNQYDAAVKIEQDAVLSYKSGTDTNALSRAMVAVSASSADALGLIFQLLPPARAAKLKGL